jgi:uncharacterized protein DUF4329
MTGMTFFRLCERRQSSVAVVRGLSCDEGGIFLGGDCALVAPTTDAMGRPVYRARSPVEINGILSAAYRRPIDFSDRMPGLLRAADHMTAGDWVMAKIAAVQLRVPDLPDDAAALRLRKADDLLRFNANHYPAGSSRGGQFAPGEQSNATMNVADSSADDITHRKFGSDEDAARNALKHFYEASKKDGVEYAGVIYRDKDGTYGITAPTTAKDGNDLHNSVIRWSDIPDGARRVASYHTHLRTENPDRDDEFSPADKYIARNQGVRSYIATPSGRLKLYDGKTRAEADLGPLQ